MFQMSFFAPKIELLKFISSIVTTCSLITMVGNPPLQFLSFVNKSGRSLIESAIYEKMYFQIFSLLIASLISSQIDSLILSANERYFLDEIPRVLCDKYFTLLGI